MKRAHSATLLFAVASAIAVLLLATPLTVAAAEPVAGKVRVDLSGLKGSATVYLNDSSRPLMQETDNAATTFENVPPGKYLISIFGASQPRVPKSIDVVAGQTVDVKLEPGDSTIQGVIRSGGKPVAGGGIRTIAPGQRLYDGTISWFASPGMLGTVFQGGVLVKPDGTYQIDGLPKGRYRLVYEAFNSLEQSRYVTLNQQTTSFDFDVPTGRIEGTLIGRTPKALGPENPLGSIQVWPVGRDLPPHTGCLVEAGEAGKFAVEQLSPGRYTLIGYGFATTVEIEREGYVAEAKLQPPDKAGEIAGTLTGEIPARTQEYQHVYVTAFPKDEGEYNFHIWNSQAYADPLSHHYQIKDVPVGT
jgi:hypothetical protein